MRPRRERLHASSRGIRWSSPSRSACPRSVLVDPRGGLDAEGGRLSFVDENVLETVLQQGQAEWSGLGDRRALLVAVREALESGVEQVNLCPPDGVAEELFTLCRLGDALHRGRLHAGRAARARRVRAGGAPARARRTARGCSSSAPPTRSRRCSAPASASRYAAVTWRASPACSRRRTRTERAGEIVGPLHHQPLQGRRAGRPAGGAHRRRRRRRSASTTCSRAPSTSTRSSSSSARDSSRVGARRRAARASGWATTRGAGSAWRRFAATLPAPRLGGGARLVSAWLRALGALVLVLGLGDRGGRGLAPHARHRSSRRPLAAYERHPGAPALPGRLLRSPPRGTTACWPLALGSLARSHGGQRAARPGRGPAPRAPSLIGAE